MTTRYHTFNIGKPYANTWWQRNLEMGVITAGFDGEEGDRGDVILHDMAEGDWVFAYANRHGFVGAGLVGTADSYRLLHERDLPPGYESNHPHMRSVRWVHYVTDLADAVPRAEIGCHAPRQTKEEIRELVLSQRLLACIKERDQSTSAEQWFPDVLGLAGPHREGSVEQVLVDRYERSPEARRECVEHWGTACVVCAFDFRTKYGLLGDGFIHVHHLIPMSERKEEYEVDPVADLRPVCPNCHAMLHRRGNPVLTIEALKAMIAKP